MGFDANVTRMLLDGGVQHKDGQQFLSGKGLAGERFPRVHRVEQHGFTSWPVQGGIATIVQARSNRDSVYAMGGANPDLIPQLGMGGTAIYDAHGGIASLVQKKMRVVADEFHVTAGSIILEGNVKLGSPGASRPASAQGTVDSAGASDQSNFATKVWVV
ncbi:phage baseplate assembly protein [Aquabacter sp. CN5-332]|uniref:phage baseplate assembly protein domain-containing protein n=1 Tax=Aquabacter sp. CN5-332 TaxID=3156608 RepID=UPI0032B3E684